MGAFIWLRVLIQLESATYDNTARQDWPGLLLEGLPGRKGAARGDFFGRHIPEESGRRYSCRHFILLGFVLQLDEA
jgi:hypothetical protein